MKNSFFVFLYLTILCFINQQKMKRNFLIISAILGMLFVSCKREVSLQNYIVGNWETTYLNIEMPTHKSSDSSYIFEDDFSKKSSLIARSEYSKDGTCSSWYVKNDGRKVGLKAGNWEVKEDSLFIKYLHKDDFIVTSYFIKKTEKGFIGKSLDDWDDDGIMDDFLLMETKRLEQ